MVALIWHRDGSLPVLDIGVFCAAVTCVYVTYPLFMFLASGLTFSTISDGRMFFHQPTAHELGAFHWRHVLYLASFALVYTAARGRVVLTQEPVLSDRRMRQNVVHLLILLYLYFWFLRAATGFSFFASYADLRYSTPLPLLLLQISIKALAVLGVCKLVLLAVLISRWRTPVCRAVVVIWLIATVLTTWMRLGSRSEAVVLLLAALLFYHRMVRPLSVRFVAPAAAVLLLGIISYGVRRDVDFGFQCDEDWATATNEFQGILANGFDLNRLREIHDLDVPWQVRLYDIIALLPPQQMLPFEKLDASEWYSRQIGADGSGVGFVFGVIAQSIVGFGIAELMVRGALLGYVLARIHRWYARKSTSLWHTVFYVWLCLKIYYTYRAGTLTPFSYVMLEFLPTLLLLKYFPTLGSRRPITTGGRRPMHITRNAMGNFGPV